MVTGAVAFQDIPTWDVARVIVKKKCFEKIMQRLESIPIAWQNENYRVEPFL
jgi:hypothetical protein